MGVACSARGWLLDSGVPLEVSGVVITILCLHGFIVLPVVYIGLH